MTTNRYAVEIHRVVDYTITVEADSPEQAERRAWSVFDIDDSRIDNVTNDIDYITLIEADITPTETYDDKEN